MCWEIQVVVKPGISDFRASPSFADLTIPVIAFFSITDFYVPYNPSGNCLNVAKNAARTFVRLKKTKAL